MSRKIILALTTGVALGAAMLAPTSASAFGHSGGGFHFAGHGSSFSRPMSHTQSFNRPTGHGNRINGPSFARGPRVDHDRHPGHPVWWNHRHHPYWVYPGDGATVETTGVATTPSYAAAPAAKNNCNCLTKSYLEDGSVMFKDLCTKEAAVATPDELKAQAEGAPSTAEQ
jgi:hypothetical protein